MDDAQGYYNHEEEVRCLHVNVVNAETESNGRRGRVEPIETTDTMRSLQKEVWSYK
jgi:hypothetical protein